MPAVMTVSEFQTVTPHHIPSGLDCPKRFSNSNPKPVGAEQEAERQALPSTLHHKQQKEDRFEFIRM